MKKFRYLQNVATLQLDQRVCTGCGRCVEVCPHQVFELSGNVAQIVDFDACMECGACALNCPVDAMRVEAGVGCAAGMINQWLREHGRGHSGSCCCS